MPLICVGHSHIVSLSKGAALSNRSIIEFRLRDISRGEKVSRNEVKGQIGEELIAAIHAHGVKSIVCLCGGGTPAVMGLIQHPQRFDFTLPDSPDLPFDRKAVPIPFNAMRAAMASRLRKHWRILRYLSEISPAKLIQLESPPPASDDSFVAKAAAKYDPGVKVHGISTAPLRYKLWKLHSNLFEDFCIKASITYVKNPPDIFDAAGFLAKPYWGDYVHANAQYGAVILQHLEGMKL